MPFAGRFAPSPTGPLHMGSLATALASWLDARANGHRWYVRMEDLDTPREDPEAAEKILDQLRCHGLIWDRWAGAGANAHGVLVQRDRHDAYAVALIQLIAKGRAYSCRCSRKKLQSAVEFGKTHYNPDGEILYPGYCTPAQPAERSLDQAQAEFTQQDQPGLAWRFRNDNGDDFVIRRADGIWAYNFAVVIDDAYQEIIRVVRGDDLFYAAPRHRALRRALDLVDPSLMHVPVVRNDQGEKLSKQTLALPLRTDNTETIRLQLECAWSHLELTMPMRWIARVRPVWRRHCLQMFDRAPIS